MGTKEKIELGDLVKDPISGIVGVVVNRTTWLHGCVRFGVQPRKLTKESKPHDTWSFDEPQLILVEKGVVNSTSAEATTGGPRPEVQRRPDVRR